MKLAPARLEGHADYTQILFVKVQEPSAKFDLAEAGLAVSEEQLRLIGPPLREKMSGGAAHFIAELPDDLASS